MIKKGNSIGKNNVLQFRANLSAEILNYIQNLKKIRKRSDFINRAIRTQYYLENYPKKFIMDLIESNYQLIKHLLRQFGRWHFVKFA